MDGCTADGGNDAADVDGMLPRKFCAGGLRVVERTSNKDAGIVDQDIETSEFMHRALHQRLDFAGFGLVRLDRQRTYAAARRRETNAQIKKSLMEGLDVTLDAMFKKKVMIASLVTFDVLFGGFLGFMVLDSTGALAYLQSGMFFDPTDGQARIRANMFTLDITDSGSAERVLTGGLGPTEALLVKQVEAALPNPGSADILWLDSQNRIVQIVSMAQCGQQECVFRPSVDSESVLYLAEGAASNGKIKAGDFVNLMLR